MELTFCGWFSEVTAPIQPGFSSTDQTTIKLIYRSLTYCVNPPAATASEVVGVAEPTVALIYRANSYQHKLQSSEPHQQPCALNRRYQILAED